MNDCSSRNKFWWSQNGIQNNWSDHSKESEWKQFGLWSWWLDSLLHQSSGFFSSALVKKIAQVDRKKDSGGSPHADFLCCLDAERRRYDLVGLFYLFWQPIKEPLIIEMSSTISYRLHVLNTHGAESWRKSLLTAHWKDMYCRWSPVVSQQEKQTG